jgi:hypothetical protein
VVKDKAESLEGGLDHKIVEADLTLSYVDGGAVHHEGDWLPAVLLTISLVEKF